MKNSSLILISQLFLTSSLLAGGATGGTPPALATEELLPVRPGTEEIEEIGISRDDMTDAIRAAMEDREIPVDIGSRQILVKPQAFDFIKKRLQGQLFDTGVPIVLFENDKIDE